MGCHFHKLVAREGTAHGGARLGAVSAAEQTALRAASPDAQQTP